MAERPSGYEAPARPVGPGDLPRVADGPAQGAVRRTPRPTGDRQTPETGPQESAGTTNTASPVSGDQPVVSSRVTSQGEPAFQAATLAVLEALNPMGDDPVYPTRSTEFAAYVAEQVEQALIGAGWRRPRPDHEAALAELRRKLAEEPDSILFAGPECDMEAYAALPPCTACEGGGQDTHGTVFEAPLAVHFAAPEVEIAGRRRQLCLWCGHVLLDVPLADGAVQPPWRKASLVKVEDGIGTVVPYAPGGELPPGCCALPDDEPVCPCDPETERCTKCADEPEPTSGIGCYPPADGWDGVSIADVPVDPNDGYPVDLCGKHTGNCSNRRLLPAHHDGECDDDPRPDEAQETRAAADWPAEPQYGDRCGAGCGNGPEDSCWHSEED